MECDQRKEVMTFQEALKEILKVEGGYVDHPQDHGSATNFGITIHTLSDFLGREATKEDVKNISQETVYKIYRQNYWDRMKLDQIRSSDVQMFLFDQAVNRGVRRVVEQLQTLVGTQPDGIMGPITITAVNQRDQRKLLIDLIKLAQNSYVSIVSTNPSQVAFLSGWIKRTQKFLERIA